MLGGPHRAQAGTARAIAILVCLACVACSTMGQQPDETTASPPPSGASVSSPPPPSEGAQEPGGDVQGLSSDDAARVGFDLAEEDQGEHISSDRAVEAALASYDFGPGTDIDPFLYRATIDGHGTDTRDPVVDRAIWIVRMRGPNVQSPREIPFPTGEGATSPSLAPLLTTLYVIVDADSGKVLFGRWED